MPGCRTWQEAQGHGAQINADSPQAIGLRLCLPMSDPSSSLQRDRSFRGTDLVMTSGVTYATTSVGRVIDINNTTSGATATASEHLLTGSFSLSYWIWAASYGTEGVFENTGTSNRNSVHNYTLSGAVRFDIWDSNAFVGHVATVDSNSTLPTSQWVHILLSHDETTKLNKLFVNGVVQTDTATNVNARDTTDLSLDHIVARSGLTGNKITAKMRDLRIYGRSMESPDVAQMVSPGTMFDLFWRKSRSVVVASAAAPASAVGHYYRNHLMARRRAS